MCTYIHAYICIHTHVLYICTIHMYTHEGGTYTACTTHTYTHVYICTCLHFKNMINNRYELQICGS